MFIRSFTVATSFGIIVNYDPLEIMSKIHCQRNVADSYLQCKLKLSVVKSAKCCMGWLKMEHCSLQMFTAG